MWVFLVFMKLMNAIPDLFGFSVNSDGVCERVCARVSLIHQKCLYACSYSVYSDWKKRAKQLSPITHSSYNLHCLELKCEILERKIIMKTATGD